MPYTNILPFFSLSSPDRSLMHNILMEKTMNENDTLRKAANCGLVKRYCNANKTPCEKWNKIQERLEYELDIIISNDLSYYFLMASNCVNWAKMNNIPVGPGCHSITGSVVAYAVQIHQFVFLNSN